MDSWRVFLQNDGLILFCFGVSLSSLMKIVKMRKNLVVWRFVALMAIASMSLPILADEDDKAEEVGEAKEQVTKHSVKIAGESLRYTATVGKLTLRSDEEQKAEAEMFYVAYTSEERSKPEERPVLFAFNGGPGSSAIWLHMAALGPRIVPTSEDGTEPLAPPHRAVENPFSILDVADLVFIDPISTGYSRATEAKKAGKFHGFRGDIDSVSDFIRLWTTKNKRWSSPKIILGESYGGIRAAGVAERLYKAYGMPVNGVVMLSSLVDYRSLSASSGNDLAYEVFFPTMVALAHFHGKIEGELDTLIQRAQEFVANEYAPTLRRGRNVTEQELRAVAQKMNELTSIGVDYFMANQLRVSASQFRRELLRAEGKVLGRFDGRVVWNARKNSGEFPSYDPSYDVIYGPISTALLDYLGRDLDWDEEQPYRVLTSKVRPWSWDSSNNYVSVADQISNALIGNPKLKILIQRGRTDLATPHEAITYSIDHLIDLPDELHKNIEYADYQAGHMFYLNQPDLEKMRDDLVKFVDAATRAAAQD